MDIKKKKIIYLIGGIVLAVIVILVGFSFLKEEEQVVSMEDPIDIAVDFYREWSNQLVATSTDPYTSGLSEELILSKELRNKIKDAKDRPEDQPDPVLCQTVFDTKFSSRKLYEGENETQVLITSKDKTLTGQAVYTLLKYKEGWYINDIRCLAGEFGPDREFSFDREGHLLKGNLIESFENDAWYLVFEEDGRPGHSAKLLFGAESKCSNNGKDESVCSPDQFPQEGAAEASVKGEMTEAGVDVKILDFTS